MSIHKNISQDKEALDIYLSEISETEPLCSEEEKKWQSVFVKVMKEL